ncbi:MAG TPA: hypothetical protein VG268_21455 [Streptosporangiaceae bacterium]|nr:hypothetical protein [Streptosporangiaceae bacterium]
MLARMFGATLDRQLAAGHVPESGRLLAVRAQQIVALPRRRELARALGGSARRGLASARVLLTDATGPVYNRRNDTALDVQLRQISAQLDPAVPLQSLVRSNT